MGLVNKILVATDFSASATHALDYATELATKFSASTLILHVYANPIVPIPDGFMFTTTVDMAELVEHLQGRLGELQAQTGKKGVTEVHTLLLEGTAWYEIVTAAREHRCDLIVMGTQGRTGLPHFFLGSVAEKVVRKAECAVLTVH